MGRIYLGKWQLVSEPEVGAYYAPPQREFLTGGALDLRGRSLEGYGLFTYRRAVADPSAGSGQAPLLAADLGDDLDRRLRPEEKTALQTLIGLPSPLEAATVLDFIFEVLGRQSDPTGEHRARPLIPGRREYRLRLGDFPVQRRAFEGFGSRAGLRSLAVLQADYRRIREDVLAGRTPADHHRKFLGYLVKKYPDWTGAGGYRLFIPDDLPDEEPLEPSTTVTETWTAADSDNPDADQDWTEVPDSTDCDYDIVSNHLEEGKNMELADGHLRCEAALSGDDHYVEAEVAAITGGGPYRGVAARCHSTSHECYMAVFNRNATGTYRIYKMFNGTLTQLASSDDTAPDTNPHAIRLEVDGSGLELFFEGSSRATATDTDITGNLRGGVCGGGAGAGRSTWDNWEAADLAAAAVRRVMVVG